MNLYTPERLTGETQDQYRTRRAAGNAAAKQMVGHHLSGGVSSRQQYRDSLRASGAMGKRTRAYKALMNATASKRVTKSPMRDKHGAYTLIGRPVKHGVADFKGGTKFLGRRMWLGGISAQRGF